MWFPRIVQLRLLCNPASMLRTRIATAVAMLGGFLSCLFLLPTAYFGILICCVLIIAATEWGALTGMTRNSRAMFATACAAVFAYMVWGVQASDATRSSVATIYAASSVFWIVVAPIWLARGTRIRSSYSATALGFLVIVPCGLAAVSVHAQAPEILLGMLGLIWIADSAAYFAGKAYGRHKLAPSISPGKTIEGAIGAIFASMAYASLAALVSPLLADVVGSIGWMAYLGVATLICALSIVGDLFESLIKRQANVKDSGNLLPGHGGILDRIDSVTSTLPLAALLSGYLLSMS